MTMYDDPNREVVGLAPIWGGAGTDNVANASGATAGSPGTWTPAGCDLPADAAQAAQLGVVASPATAWATNQYVQGSTPGAAGEMTWTGSQWVGGRAPLDGMTKDELLAYAQQRGITPANASMTKDELRAGIEQYHQAGGA